MEAVLSDEEVNPIRIEPICIGRISNPKKISNLLKFLEGQVKGSSTEHLKRIIRRIAPPIVSVLQTPDPPKNSDDEMNLKYELTKNEHQWIVICKKSEWVNNLSDEVKTSLLQTYEVDAIVTVLAAAAPPISPEQASHANQLWPTHWSARAYTPSTPPVSSITEDKLNEMKANMRKAIEVATQAKENGQLPVGCVILNTKGEVVATAGDNRRKSCLKHAVIVALDSISENQRIQAQQLGVGNVDYLCTGYSVYVTREPCIMCSMALLHSRVSLVVYGVEKPDDGGLGSKYKIHCQKALNHSFHVYKGLLAEECAKLTSE